MKVMFLTAALCLSSVMAFGAPCGPNRCAAEKKPAFLLKLRPRTVEVEVSAEVADPKVEVKEQHIKRVRVVKRVRTVIRERRQ